MTPTAWLAAATLFAASGSPTATLTQPDAAPTAADAAYAIGYDIGQTAIAQLGFDAIAVDTNELARGFADAIADRTPRLDDVVRRQVLSRLERLRADREARKRVADDPVFAALVEANLAQSDAFHQRFGASNGVVTLPSGVQYRVLRDAEGPTPGPDARVVISYSLKTLAGEEVAAEDYRELQLDYLFNGAADTLTRMPTGSVWQLAVPPEQAFGLGGQPPLIGPNQSILVDVQLHEIR